MEKDCYTVNEVAEYFNVNAKTTHRRLWARGIPALMIGRT
jgi:excisionase family DNA binding protein